jgi:hypothetical protein
MRFVAYSHGLFPFAAEKKESCASLNVMDETFSLEEYVKNSPEYLAGESICTEAEKISIAEYEAAEACKVTLERVAKSRAVSNVTTDIDDGIFGDTSDVETQGEDTKTEAERCRNLLQARKVFDSLDGQNADGTLTEKEISPEHILKSVTGPLHDRWSGEAYKIRLRRASKLMRKIIDVSEHSEKKEVVSFEFFFEWWQAMHFFDRMAKEDGAKLRLDNDGNFADILKEKVSHATRSLWEAKSEVISGRLSRAWDEISNVKDLDNPHDGSATFTMFFRWFQSMPRMSSTNRPMEGWSENAESKAANMLGVEVGAPADQVEQAHRMLVRRAKKRGENPKVIQDLDGALGLLVPSSSGMTVEDAGVPAEPVVPEADDKAGTKSLQAGKQNEGPAQLLEVEASSGSLLASKMSALELLRDEIAELVKKDRTVLR